MPNPSGGAKAKGVGRQNKLIWVYWAVFKKFIDLEKYIYMSIFACKP
jgi:hypothetical protein